MGWQYDGGRGSSPRLPEIPISAIGVVWRIMLTIRAHDMHTGGEPVRIVVSGDGDVPIVPGSTILQKREHASKHLDHIRKLL